MKIEVEVKGALSRWSLRGREQENYLLIEVFGVEIEVPCTEEQIVTVIAHAQGSAKPPVPDESNPVQARSVFAVEPDEPASEDAPRAAPERERQLRPIKRPREDDAGIAQG